MFPLAGDAGKVGLLKDGQFDFFPVVIVDYGKYFVLLFPILFHLIVEDVVLSKGGVTYLINFLRFMKLFY